MYSRLARSGRVWRSGAAVALAGSGYLYYSNERFFNSPNAAINNDVKLISPVEKPLVSLPKRSDLLANLDKTHDFDVLIIGGGATGTGCALDASTRGLNVLLVEQHDFAFGTSSKSTKMAHGGVRYLEKAVLKFSKEQLDLVIEALNERANMVNNAPHLCKILPIMIPVYGYLQIPYYYMGVKLYDIFAGSQNLKSSYLLSKQNVLEIAPMVNPKGLKAGLVYHDGSFNDSRLNATLAISAIENGATVLNYMEVVQLIKDPINSKITGAIIKDRETDKIYKVKSKVVVNATGPYSDKILQMDKNENGLPDFSKHMSGETISSKLTNSVESKIAVENPKMVVPSSGVHIILPSYYCPKEFGFLDSNTSDGRVMFFLPWQGKVLAGTTDIPMKTIPENPTPKESDIQDILKELQHYIKFPVKREDVLSAWAGIRPLVQDPRTLVDAHGAPTQELVRSHFIFTSDNGLVTIAGGKWTTYREMAEETIDTVVKNGRFNVKPCVTKNYKLAGANNWDPNLSALLSQKYGLSSIMAKHLADNYGTRAPIICELFNKNKYNKLPINLADKVDSKLTLDDVDYNTFRYPYTIGELKYSIDYEYTRTALDFLLRRTRYAFLDARQAMDAIPGTVKIMGDQLNWDEKRREYERKATEEYIKTFGI